MNHAGYVFLGLMCVTQGAFAAGAGAAGVLLADQKAHAQRNQQLVHVHTARTVSAPISCYAGFFQSTLARQLSVPYMYIQVGPNLSIKSLILPYPRFDTDMKLLVAPVDESLAVDQKEQASETSMVVVDATPVPAASNLSANVPSVVTPKPTRSPIFTFNVKTVRAYSR